MKKGQLFIYTGTTYPRRGEIVELIEMCAWGSKQYIYGKFLFGNRDTRSFNRINLRPYPLPAQKVLNV